MRGVKWKELVKVCEGEGCEFDRQKGDHYIMTKPGMSRPVVIPRKNNLKLDADVNPRRFPGRPHGTIRFVSAALTRSP